MKNKYTYITVASTLAIIIAGYFLLSLMTHGYLSVVADIHEETDSSELMKTAADEMVQRFLYPLLGYDSEETKVITESEFSYYLGNLDPYTMLKDVASISKQDPNISYSQIKSTISDNKDFVMEAYLNSGYQITTAYSYGAFAGFYCRPTAQVTEEQIKTAIEDLQVINEKDNQAIITFLNSVEDLNNKREPFAEDFSYEIPLLLYSMISQADEKYFTHDNIEDFYEAEHSLYDCYEYGNKGIFTNGKEVILLSSVGNCGLALFYDPIDRKFSGINIITYS